MNIDEFKAQIKHHVSTCIETLSNESPFFDLAKQRYEIKINKNSETIYLCNSAVIKIVSPKDQAHLELSNNYIDIFKLRDMAKFTKSNRDWGKMTFNESIAQQIIERIEAVFIQCYQEEPAESFGCCSRYNECSDKKECIHPDPKFAQGCMYKENLEKGRIFYGRNRNTDNQQ